MKKAIFPNFDQEAQFSREYKRIAGVDEVGRGCLAGPVVACAVILPKDFNIPSELNDSKKLAPKTREKLFEELTNNTNIDFGLGWVDESKIDEINILQATFLAMKKAVDNLSNRADFLLIDGNKFVSGFRPHKCIIMGDQKSVSIATASIIAKVSRDKYMSEFVEKKYPEYGFSKHKGYATKKHFDAIDNHGVSPIHRLSFLRKYHARQLSLFT